MSAAKPLGRGLDALLGANAPADRPDAAEDAPARLLPVSSLVPGRLQPRRRFDTEALEALTLSIREQGVLQPLLARPAEGAADRFEIVAGERRWRAAQRAGLEMLPVVVRALDDRAALEAALSENVQRDSLSPIEEAEGYKRLQTEFGHTQERLARAVGRSRPHIANMLRLLSLPESVRDLLHERRLTAGHARALIPATDPAALARRVVREGLSVRRTEVLASSRQRRRRARERDPDIVAVEQELGERLGLRVTLAGSGETGSLSLHYRSLDQLDDLLTRLRG